eukprot:CAMPEP_0202957684 /NCGR_PEP_ID=MMETSP1396-20130829/2070_1 /ASSEMBLY_ACC=CAM_ASM_000872 /TAXON_ID= /ORGANISM="Pseudokeronopsis sp., Strain Brazil" /LENGTH=118 /DNA_ID=CAMNT_0049675315 /DNA_START=425 /DNA_END=781 /DNA_ORIENTATION=+
MMSQPPSQELLESKGCTANVVYIRDNWLYIANAGDSRSVLCSNGKAIPLSTDHKPHLPSERQRILKAGSTINAEGRIDGNLNLSRSIGDIRYKKNKNLRPHEHPVTSFPDVKKIQLSP